MSEPTKLRTAIADVLEASGIAPTIVVHFDGACEPRNPGGIATCGWTVHEGGKLIGSGFQEVCRGDGATNNVAEYCALGFALKWLLETGLGGKAVLDIRGDSQLVVEQLNGNWKCNKDHLRRLRDRCKALLQEIMPASWRATWIPREQNGEADALSRRAYEEATGKVFPERNRR